MGDSGRREERDGSLRRAGPGSGAELGGANAPGFQVPSTQTGSGAGHGGAPTQGAHQRTGRTCSSRRVIPVGTRSGLGLFICIQVSGFHFFFLQNNYFHILYTIFLFFFINLPIHIWQRCQRDSDSAPWLPCTCCLAGRDSDQTAARHHWAPGKGSSAQADQPLGFSKPSDSPGPAAPASAGGLSANVLVREQMFADAGCVGEIHRPALLLSYVGRRQGAGGQLSCQGGLGHSTATYSC